MEELIIEFNTKKQLKILVLGVFLSLASLAFVYHIVFISDRIKIFYLAMFLLLFIVSLVMVFKHLQVILSKDKTALILNRNGIICNTTPNGKKLGLVEWKDIDDMKMLNVYNSSFITLITNNKDKYLEKLKTAAEKKMLLEQNAVLNISSDSINLSFEELKQILTEYYTKSR